jgi:hypothetical protein
VIAAALFELWPLLSDPVLAATALTASIACRDFWDARAARAALWLQVGEEAKAAEDLDRALSGNDRNRNLEPDENEPMVVAVDAFEPVLRPIRGLLEPTLSSFARIALWNAAVESWNSRTGDRAKRLTSEPAKFRILRTYLEQHSEEEAITTSLSQLLMALAKSLPPRVPFGGLRESDFYRKPDEIPLDPEVVTSLRTAIGDAPQNKDESISGLPSLESVLDGSLESWLSRRGSDLQSLDLRPPPAAGRQGRRISVEDSV